LSGGTANGVAYLNGSKALTTGSALTFDGTNLSVGGAGGTTRGVSVVSTALTGTTQYGLTSQITSTSSATSSTVGFYAGVSTAASAYTASAVRGVWVDDAGKGAGSTITNQQGVYISDQTKGTNNYGITSLVSSGTNKWNIYASGTADNYFAGYLGLNISTPTYKLDIYNVSGGNPGIRIQGNDQSNVRLRLANIGTGGINWDLISGLNGVSNAFFSIYNATSSTNALVIDASNNLGVGIAPQAKFNVQYTDSAPTASGTMVSGAVLQYATGGVALNMGSSSSGYSYFNSAFANNAGVGSAYRFYQGATQAVTLDANGNFLVGTTTATYNAASRGVIEVNGSSTSLIALKRAAAQSAYFLASAGEFQINNTEATPITFYVNSAERGRFSADGTFRVKGAGTAGSTDAVQFSGSAPASAMALDSSGNLLVGTTTNTNTSKLVVNGTISQTVSGTQYLVVDQSDIGTAANEIPLNQYLGRMAYKEVEGLEAQLNPAPTIASAATIQPLAPITFVSGTTTINTITVPSEFVGGGQITLIPTALWSTGTSGNIAIATTGVVSKALILTYDATTAKWYPSY
jgi:hypothetical protein